MFQRPGGRVNKFACACGARTNNERRALTRFGPVEIAVCFFLGSLVKSRAVKGKAEILKAEN
jgi:hypothetical protein